MIKTVFIFQRALLEGDIPPKPEPPPETSIIPVVPPSLKYVRGNPSSNAPLPIRLSNQKETVTGRSQHERHI